MHANRGERKFGVDGDRYGSSGFLIKELIRVGVIWTDQTSFLDPLGRLNVMQAGAVECSTRGRAVLWMLVLWIGWLISWVD